MTASDEDIYSLNGKTSQGTWTSQSPTCAIYSTYWHFIHYANEHLVYSRILCIFYNFWIRYIYHITGSHVWIHFYLHPPDFTSFSFYLLPHFHSVFCLVFFHLITAEFEQNLYDISSPRNTFIHGESYEIFANPSPQTTFPYISL